MEKKNIRKKHNFANTGNIRKQKKINIIFKKSTKQNDD